MSVAFMTSGRVPYAAGDRLRGTPEELTAAADTYVSYCGRYELLEDRVIHHIEVSLFPNWVGVAQTRYITLDGNRLTLRTPTGADGRQHADWARPLGARGGLSGPAFPICYQDFHHRVG